MNARKDLTNLIQEDKFVWSVPLATIAQRLVSLRQLGNVMQVTSARWDQLVKLLQLPFKVALANQVTTAL